MPSSKKAKNVQSLQYDGTNGPDVISWVSGFVTQNSANVGHTLLSSTEVANVITFTWSGGLPPTTVIHLNDWLVLDVLTFRVFDAATYALTYP